MTLRLVSRSLRPQALEHLGLVASLRQMVTDVAKRTAIDCTVDVTGEERTLPPDIELAVFRIAQEALRNAEKHSGATRVKLAVRYDPKAIHVTVADNGAGFAMPSGGLRLTPANQMGLLGMQERAVSVGADLKIDSVPGQGTFVSLSVGAPNPEPKL